LRARHPRDSRPDRGVTESGNFLRAESEAGGGKICENAFKTAEEGQMRHGGGRRLSSPEKAKCSDS